MTITTQSCPPCDECGKRLRWNQAFMVMDYRELDDVKMWREQWERQKNKLYGPPVQGLQLINAADIRSFWAGKSSSVSWHWTCKGCPPAGYNIPGTHLNTSEKILRATLHLLDSKEWIQETDWGQALRRLGLVPILDGPF